MDDMEQQVRRALENTLDDVEPTPLLPSRHLRRAKTRRVVTASFGALGIAAAVAAASWGGLAINERLSQPVASPTPSESPDPWAGVASGWNSLPPPPLAAKGFAQAWTGQELVLWSGSTADGTAAPPDGVAFSPQTNEWRKIAPAPLDGRYFTAHVWTGNELIVWGGQTNNGFAGDGAAYNPVNDSWRKISSAPLSPRVPLDAVWTGDEMIVWGTSADPDPTADGAAYNPVTNEWRELATAPIRMNQGNATWTGNHMIVHGSLLDDQNVAAGGKTVGAIYDPTNDNWTLMSPSQLSPQATSMEWTGSAGLVWDYLLDAAQYNPEMDEWRKLEPLPLEESECYPSSAAIKGFVMGWYCGQAALFKVDNEAWERIPHPDESHLRISARDSLAPFGAGSVFVVTGITREGANEGTVWAYKP